MHSCLEDFAEEAGSKASEESNVRLAQAPIRLVNPKPQLDQICFSSMKFSEHKLVRRRTLDRSR